MEDLCAPGYILGLLGRKWLYRILRHLREPARFSDLEKALPSITNHMLSEELKRLESEGLLTHEANEYKLTAAGMELLDAVDCLIRWAHKHKRMALCPPHQSCANCLYYRD